MTLRRLTRGALLLIAALCVASCGEDKVVVDPGPPYLPQTSPQNVLKNLQLAHQAKDIDGYCKLLADDFQSTSTKERASRTSVSPSSGR